MTQFLKAIGKTQLMSIIAIVWTLATIALYFGFGNASDQTIEKAQSIQMMVVSFLFGKGVADKKNEHQN